MLEPGANTIQGNALIRQQGGGVVACPGFEVYLAPATDYVIERMRKICGLDDRGFSADNLLQFQPN